MKKSILTLAAIAGISIITSCSSPAQKVEIEEKNVINANKDLDEANVEYMTEVDRYRKETADRIAANEKNIADFNLRIEHEKKDAKADYEKKIADLEKKNSDMKMKMADYKADSKENWAAFKAAFNRDMDDLGDALKKLTTNEPK
jgi:septal ring factor EnvC (AmiA/AmiB activator)